MIYKCRAMLRASCLVDAKDEEDARRKAESIIREKLSKPEDVPLDSNALKVEPFDFMNKKIILCGCGPLSGEY